MLTRSACLLTVWSTDHTVNLCGTLCYKIARRSETSNRPLVGYTVEGKPSSVSWHCVVEMYGRVVVWLYTFLALVVDGVISQLDAAAAQYPFHWRMSETIMYVKVLTACGTENGYLKSCRTGIYSN